ncbi:MAG: hypothetical protein ACYSWZ_11540 [Planctomycetota bacterium]|jgi:hypothetical protein
MKTEEKRSDKGKYEEKCCETSCFEGQGFAEKASRCCASTGEGVDCRSMMGECMKGCRWFPLIPVVFGILLLLLGFYLNAEITRILWMMVAGFVILMGTFGLLMMSKAKTMFKSAE